MIDLLDRLGMVLTDEEIARLRSTRKLVPVPIPIPIPAKRLFAKGLHHEYSTMYPGDSKHDWILLQHPQGFYGLHRMDGSLREMLPAQINHSSQPRWRRGRKADTFLFLYLNEIREYDVSTGKISTLRKFKNLANINGLGESDLSEDGDHLVLCSGAYVFVYELSSDRILAEFTAEWAFSELYLSSENEIIIGFLEQGIQLYHAATGALHSVTSRRAHMDVSSAKDGSPILVYTQSNEPEPVETCNNGILLVELNTLKETCLTALPWNLAVHISLPERATFALVSTFDPLDAKSTVPFANEILKVNLDGSGVVSLGKHQSKADVYERQPRASVSPDGTRYIFDANGDVFAGTI